MRFSSSWLASLPLLTSLGAAALFAGCATGGSADDAERARAAGGSSSEAGTGGSNTGGSSTKPNGDGGTAGQPSEGDAGSAGSGVGGTSAGGSSGSGGNGSAGKAGANAGGASGKSGASGNGGSGNGDAGSGGNGNAGNGASGGTAGTSGAGGTSGVLSCPAGEICLGGTLAVRTGNGHSCAIRADRTIACWGWNLAGQLGTGDKLDRLRAIVVPGVDGVLEVALGDVHTCVLRQGGTVTCWGDNDDGQLGTGDAKAKLSPGAPIIGLADVVAIAAGGLHTCALLKNGTVKCWGRNYNGQLGLGAASDAPKPSPTLVPGLTDVSAISLNSAHSCALSTNGTARCWGLDSSGEIGTGADLGGNVPSPSVVQGLAGASQLSSGGFHNCARLGDGTVRAWGMNAFGQLGLGDKDPRTSATPVTGLVGVQSVTSSAYHSCALLEDGTARCWGFNLRGQLGTSACKGGDVDSGSDCKDSLVPAVVVGAPRLVEIDARWFHTCGRDESGGVSCWGGNYLGQLGDGTMVDRGAPKPVFVQP